MPRNVKPLAEHTFTDTGHVVKIRKLSPFLRDDINADLRKKDRAAGTFPVAPMVAGVEGKLEPNDSDPDYIMARGVYFSELANRVQAALLKLAITRGVEVDLTDEVKDEIAALREEYKAQDIEIDEEDKYFYITRICVGSNDDLQELYDGLFKRSMPTREAVEAHKATFPSDVSGQTD